MRCERCVVEGGSVRGGGGMGRATIHSFIKIGHSLETLISAGSIDRRGEARSNGSGDAREPGMRMKRDVRETDASSFRFADEAMFNFTPLEREEAQCEDTWTPVKGPRIGEA